MQHVSVHHECDVGIFSTKTKYPLKYGMYRLEPTADQKSSPKKLLSTQEFRFRGRKLFEHDVSCDINADMSADRTKIHSRDTSHDLVSFSPQDDEFGRRNHDG